jgi:hypothetical protein
VDLKKIMQHHHQFPLPIDFSLPSKAESFDSDGIGDVTKHRFRRAQSLAVDVPASWAV